jgi:hypothetical protein
MRVYSITTTLKFYTPSYIAANDAANMLAEKMGVEAHACQYWLNVPLEGLTTGTLTALARWAKGNPLVTGASYWTQRGPCGDWSPEAPLASEDLAQLAAGHNEPERTRTTPLAALIQDFVSLASQANETETSLNSAIIAARAEAQAQAEVARQAQIDLAAANARAARLANERNRARKALQRVRRAAKV